MKLSELLDYLASKEAERMSGLEIVFHDQAKTAKRLEETVDTLLEAVQKAYRKHHLEDDSIGWDELADDLHNALCEVMTDRGYQDWLKSL